MTKQEIDYQVSLAMLGGMVRVVRTRCYQFKETDRAKWDAAGRPCQPALAMVSGRTLEVALTRSPRGDGSIIVLVMRSHAPYRRLDMLRVQCAMVAPCGMPRTPAEFAIYLGVTGQGKRPRKRRCKAAPAIKIGPRPRVHRIARSARLPRQRDAKRPEPISIPVSEACTLPCASLRAWYARERRAHLLGIVARDRFMTLVQSAQ